MTQHDSTYPTVGWFSIPISARDSWNLHLVDNGFLEITMPHKAHHRRGCLPPFSWRCTSRQRRGKNSRKRGRSQQSSFCRNPTIKNTNINQYQISVRVLILGVYTMIHHALSGIRVGFLGFNRHHRPAIVSTKNELDAVMVRTEVHEGVVLKFRMPKIYQNIQQLKIMIVTV